MSQFLVVGNDSEPTLLDHFSAGYTNPLFADVNNDGLDDVWEQANGLSLSVDNRQGMQADGSNNLQVYLNSNAGVLGVNLTPPVITSLVDSSGVPGAGGLVSVLVTGSDGSPIAYAPVTFTVNGSGALIASASGSGGDSRITVQTDASGVARAYVNFASASPVDMLVMAQNSITSTATSATQIGASASLSLHLVPPVIIDFEQADGYLPGSLDQQQGWSIIQGAASISNQDAYSGSNSIAIEPGAKILQATPPPLPGKDIVYVDFYAKPAVEDDITKSTTFEIGGARFAFVTSYGSDDGQHATLEAFTGDGQGSGVWAPNSSDINLGWGNVSLTWVHLAARLNYSKKTWDLYLNGKMIAADLGLLDNTITALTSFAVTGSADYQSSLDHIYVGSTNLLFADANNDGIDDPWESQYSLSLSSNDRDLHPSGSNTSVVQAYVEGLDPNDFFEGQAPIITFMNSSGAVGAQGSVSIKITNADGTLFVNGKVSVSSTTGASQVSSNAGESGSSQVTVTTDANGIAQVYVVFTTSDPNEVISVTLPDNGTWANPGTATKITLSNPLLPVMMAETIVAGASKYGVYASQYLFSIPDGWNTWDPLSHRTFLPTSPQKYYRTMTIASGIGTITALDGTQTSSGPFTIKYTMVDEETPITPQSDAPYWFPGDVGPTIIDSVTSAHFNTLRLDLFQKGTTAIFPHVTMELGDEYTTTELIANGLASGGTFTGSRHAVDFVSLSYGLYPEETEFRNDSAQFQFVWNTAANLNVPLTATWLITYTPFSVSGQPDPTPVCTTVTAPVVDGKTEWQTFVPPRDKYGTYAINYIAAAMAVDANCDGQIKEDASDATSTDKPFRFWINDDDDAHTTFQRADSTTATVDGVDDLTDFFPVFLDIKKILAVLPPDSGYTYTLKQADGALDFAYTSLTRSTAFTYQNSPYSYAAADTRQVTATGVPLDTTFLNTIKNGTQDEGVIICEGNKPSLQPLVLVVEKGGVEVTEISLQLSIGQDIVLLIHGMNSNVNTWDSFVTHAFGTSPSASDSIIDRNFSMTYPPNINTGGVRCYRLQAGANETAGTTRQGLENLTTSNAMGQNPSDNQLVPYLSLPLVKCGDFETFDELGQEVDDAISLLVARHPNAHIVLVGHSRGGLSARAFLENPNYAAEQAAVVGCLVTSSPQQGSPMGRIWNYLATPGHRRTEYDSNGQPLMVLNPAQDPSGPISYLPVNYQDWGTVDFLMATTIAGTAKPFLDVRRPVIMDVADDSAAILHLNNPTQVANLPSNITYGEVVYRMANFGLISTGQIPDYQGTSLGIAGSYSVFGFYNGGWVPNLLFSSLSTATRNFITSNRSPDDLTLIGDGLIPAANQIYTTLPSFPHPVAPATSNTIPQLVNQMVLSVHTDAPSRFEDLLQQLRQMEPHWFP